MGARMSFRVNPSEDLKFKQTHSKTENQRQWETLISLNFGTHSESNTLSNFDRTFLILDAHEADVVVGSSYGQWSRNRENTTK